MKSGGINFSNGSGLSSKVFKYVLYRYLLNSDDIPLENFQLLGTTAIFIASKYEVSELIID